MTLQAAHRAWQDTQCLVTDEPISQHDIKLRNYAWDVYCAIRDGHSSNYYANRRRSYGNPKITDNQIKRIKENKRSLVH